MGSNNDGFNGVEIEHIALEKNVLVGVQSPNLSPCVKIDANGKSLLKVVYSENAGISMDSTHGFDCKYADTSWLSHGGIYSMTAGNKMNFTAGGGGFEMSTNGPTKFNTVFADFWATHAFNVNTRLFTVSSSQRTHLMGGRIDLDYDETYINGNVNLINNVSVNGSLYVNGELYCRHMTGVGQRYNTKNSADMTGYINPQQSFVVFSGASTSAQSLQPAIDCTISIPFPDPIGKTMSLPCKITFTNGISLASDSTMASASAETTATITQGAARTPNPNTSDLMGPGHSHEFVGPPFQPSNDSSMFFAEAKEAMESNTPMNAKKSMPNGCSSIEQFASIIEQAITDAAAGYEERAKSYILGLFSSLFGGGS